MCTIAMALPLRAWSRRERRSCLRLRAQATSWLEVPERQAGLRQEEPASRNKDATSKDELSKSEDPWRLSEKFKLSLEQERFVKIANKACAGEVITLHGGTGTGKTLAISAAIAKRRQPTLWMTSNKSLVFQLYEEVVDYLPDGEAHRYVSAFKDYHPSCVTNYKRRAVLSKAKYRPALGDVCMETMHLRTEARKAVAEKHLGLVVLASGSAVWPIGTNGEFSDGPNCFGTVGGHLTKDEAVNRIQAELTSDLETLGKEEADNLNEMVKKDMISIKERGFCREFADKYGWLVGNGGRTTLIDLFNESFGTDWCLVLDETHSLGTQLVAPGKAHADRKKTLIDQGFRLKGSLGSGPLSLEELSKRIPKTLILSSATPLKEDPRKIWKFEGKHTEVKMVHRPTHILDPIVEFREYPKNIFESVLEDIKEAISKGGQVLLLGITCAQMEAMTKKLHERGIIRSGILSGRTGMLERIELLNKFKRKELDVLAGIRLLKEGMDLPGVSLVIVLDADRSGFLRSKCALLQMAGRATRNTNGKVMLYGEKRTDAIIDVIDETKQRRDLQKKFNTEHGFVPSPLDQKERPLAAFAASNGAAHPSGADVGRGRPERTHTIMKPPAPSAKDMATFRKSFLFQWEKNATLDQRIDQLAMTGFFRFGSRKARLQQRVCSVPLTRWLKKGRLMAARLLDTYGSLENLRLALDEFPRDVMAIRGIGENTVWRILTGMPDYLFCKEVLTSERALSEEVAMVPDGDRWGDHFEPLLDWSLEARRIRGENVVVESEDGKGDSGKRRGKERAVPTVPTEAEVRAMNLDELLALIDDLGLPVLKYGKANRRKADILNEVLKACDKS